MRLHGVWKKILSYGDAKFTSMFWKELLMGLGIELAFTATYHPHTYG